MDTCNWMPSVSVYFHPIHALRLPSCAFLVGGASYAHRGWEGMHCCNPAAGLRCTGATGATGGATGATGAWARGRPPVDLCAV